MAARQRLQTIYAHAAPRKSYPARRVIQQMAEDNPEPTTETPTPAPAQVATGDDPRTMEQKEAAVAAAQAEVEELASQVDTMSELTTHFSYLQEISISMRVSVLKAHWKNKM